MKLTDINDIKKLLSEEGFRFSKSMGQNFLTAAWVPERIAEEANLDEGTGVLEIGPGIGCLTEQLSMRAGKVLALELDRSLKPVLKRTLSGRDNVEIVFADAMKTDIPALCLDRFGEMRRCACANLPYNITSPIITTLLEARCFDSVTLMIQREVARRICARPGTADYSSFSVLVQWYAEPKMLFDVGPECFIPQPKVTSTVLRLDCRKEPPVSVKSERIFFRTVRGAFAVRRKTLLNALSSAFGELNKDELRNIIISCGFDEKIRGETLGIGDFAKISDGIWHYFNKNL